MDFDGWSVLMALGVILLPLLLAGALLGRPPRMTEKRHADASPPQHPNEKQ